MHRLTGVMVRIADALLAMPSAFPISSRIGSLSGRPKLPSKQMNEWLKLGSGNDAANGRLWVVAAAAGIDQHTPSGNPDTSRRYCWKQPFGTQLLNFNGPEFSS